MQATNVRIAAPIAIERVVSHIECLGDIACIIRDFVLGLASWAFVMDSRLRGNDG